METVLRCDCGFEIRAGDDRTLVSLARDHALRVHGMELSADDVLRLAATRAGVGREAADDRQLNPHVEGDAP
jgi:predicted small metal-binding protein